MLADPPSVLRQHRAELVTMLRAFGVGYRELRDLDRSAAVLAIAADEAAALGDRHLIGLVKLSRSPTLLYQGDVPGAIACADDAVALLDGSDDYLTAVSQRAGVLARAGRVEEALVAFDQALEHPLAKTPSSSLAELYNHRGTMLGYLGQFDDAERDFAVALDFFQAQGHRKRAADLVHNLAWLAGRRGDLAEALRLFDEAADGYDPAEFPAERILPDRCEVLLAAGLLDEALTTAEAACDSFAERGDHSDRGEALILVAQIALALDEHARAVEAANQASSLFSRSGRTGWRAHAEALALAGAVASGAAPVDALEQIPRLRAALVDAGLDLPVYDLDVVHTRLLLDAGRVVGAQRILRRLSTPEAPIHARVAAHVLRAHAHFNAGQIGPARHDLSRALDTIDATRSTLTSSELRAALAVHAAEAARLSLRLAAQDRRPFMILRWAERSRARSLRYAAVVQHRPFDPLDEALDRLRQLERQVASIPPDAVVPRQLRADINAAARRVRALSRHGSRPIPPIVAEPTLSAIRARLDGGHLIQLVDDGDHISAVIVARHSTSLHRVGPSATVEREAVLLRGALSMALTHPRAEHGGSRVPARLAASTQPLDALLAPCLPPTPGPVVIIPTPELHVLPWATLPGLAGRAFTVAPSISAWMTATERRGSDRHGAMVIAAGPRLAHAEPEADAIARLSAGANKLIGAAANSKAMASALLHAQSAHIACHGRFVASNPLLSALELFDGPLYLYDIERVGIGCSTVVLSACNGGRTSHRPGEELMGFVATFLAAGCATLIAASVELPDTQATVDAMVTLHQYLLGGASPAAALVGARLEHPLIGSALTAFGSGR
jgi:tetratricopeptide (TPR) repeat protein